MKQKLNKKQSELICDYIMNLTLQQFRYDSCMETIIHNGRIYNRRHNIDMDVYINYGWHLPFFKYLLMRVNTRYGSCWLNVRLSRECKKHLNDSLRLKQESIKAYIADKL